MGTIAGSLQMKAVGALLPDLAVGAPPRTRGAAFGIWSSSSSRPVQLQQVVARTDERPLFADRPPAAAQELAEAARVLDLPERGFHDRFTSGVEGGAPQGGQEARHALLDGQAGGRPPARPPPPPVTVCASTRGDPRLDPPRLHGGGPGRRPIAPLRPPDPPPPAAT